MRWLGSWILLLEAPSYNWTQECMPPLMEPNGRLKHKQPSVEALASVGAHFGGGSACQYPLAICWTHWISDPLSQSPIESSIYIYSRAWGQRNLARPLSSPSKAGKPVASGTMTYYGEQLPSTWCRVCNLYLGRFKQVCTKIGIPKNDKMILKSIP